MPFSTCRTHEPLLAFVRTTNFVFVLVFGFCGPYSRSIPEPKGEQNSSEIDRNTVLRFGFVFLSRAFRTRCKERAMKL